MISYRVTVFDTKTKSEKIYYVWAKSRARAVRAVVDAGKGSNIVSVEVE